MKRRITSLALLLIAMLALSACSLVAPVPPATSGSTATEEGEAASSDIAAEDITVEDAAAIVLMGGPNLDDATLAAIAYCEDKLDISVEFIAGPRSVTDRLALFLQFFGVGANNVDAMAIDMIWPGILAEHLVDLRPYMTDEQYNAHFESILQNNTVDGALIGIPLDTGAGMLYFRIDLLKKYGYDAGPETWAELEEMATTIQEGERAEGNEDFWGYVWQGAAYEGLTCDALEWQVSWNGGSIVEPDGTISINNPNAAAALDMAAGWVGTISPPGVTGYGEEGARGVWQGGNTAFMRNWPYAYSLGNMEGSSIAGKFGVSPLPTGGEEGRNAATLGGFQVSVSRYSDHVDTAADFAVCVTGYESQKIRATQASYLPTINALYEDEDVLAANPFFSELQDVVARGGVARPSTVTSENYNQVSTIYFIEVNKVLTGDQTGQEAVESIESQLQDLLTN